MDIIKKNKENESILDKIEYSHSMLIDNLWNTSNKIHNHLSNP
jgi:hypothetical protein